MTKTQFKKLAKIARLEECLSLSAAYRVLVDGLSVRGAAREAGINQGGLHRYVAKFPRKLCSCCGQVVRSA